MPCREIATAPVRSADQTWTVISALVRDTLTRSASIPAADVDAALTAAATVGRPLIAGGHLNNHPVVLVTDDLQLSITTVSGTKAFAVEENLNPVPGAARATQWTLHLPAPDPLGSLVAVAVTGVAHLSVEPAPTTPGTQTAAGGPTRPSLRIDPGAITARTQ